MARRKHYYSSKGVYYIRKGKRVYVDRTPTSHLKSARRRRSRGW